MNKFCQFMFLILACLLAVSIGEAANPTDYVTMHGALSRASSETGNGYIGNNFKTYGYYPRCRVFIPPGTKYIDLRIYRYDRDGVVARHEVAPTGDPIRPTSTVANPYTLSALEREQRWANHNADYLLKLVSDSFSSPYLSIERGGWIYFKVDGSSSSNFGYELFTYVDAATYNDWWDNYGSNSDGSINYDRDIESVTEYLPPDPVPGKAVVSPSSGTWTSSPQELTITSSGAEKIYGNITSATGDAIPENPTVPSASNYNWSVTGNSGKYSLVGEAGSLKQFKARFVGYNSNGTGAESGILNFSIDLRPLKPETATVSPASGTGFTTSPVKITVKSVNAGKIYYTQTSDGSDPPEPDPDEPDSPYVNGPEGELTISGTADELTTVKIRVKGYNLNGGGIADVSTPASYVFDLRPVPPGAVTVTPTTGFAVGTTPRVTLASSGATKIYASYKITTDGSEPADPDEPSSISPVALNSSSGTYTLPYYTGQLTRIKVCFRGYNGDGWGPVTDTYSYQVDATGSAVPLPGTPTTNPASGTFSSSPQNITVTSSNATSIFFSKTTSTTGIPEDPPDPTSGGLFGGNAVSGPTGTVAVESVAGQKTVTKIRFVGYNSTGYGPLSAIYTYTVDLTGMASNLPGVVEVSPDSTSWATAPQSVSASSVNAAQIDYVYVKTEDGREPADPVEPGVWNLFLNIGQFKDSISGATGTFSIPSTAGKKTRVKIRFAGKNQYGYGPTTGIYEYEIDLTGLKSPISWTFVKTNPGIDLSGLITNPNNLIDPNIKFFLPDAGPNQSLDLEEDGYSVLDLVREYLQKLDPNMSVTCDAQMVLTVRNPFWSDVYPLITTGVYSCAENDNLWMTGTGGIMVINQNILIKLGVAGAYESQVASWIQGVDWQLTYAKDHLGMIDTGEPDGKMLAFRYEFGAHGNPDPNQQAGEACHITCNGDGSFQVMYGDGTVQKVVPYVHNAEKFEEQVKKQYNFVGAVYMNPMTGSVQLFDTQYQLIWTGQPEFTVDPTGASEPNVSIYPGDNQETHLRFSTETGAQNILSQP